MKNLNLSICNESILIVVLSSYVTPGPYFERTVRTSSKSLNGRKIARMAPILTIFGPNRSRRRDLFFEKFSNERRRHRRLVLVSSSPSSSPPSSPSSPSSSPPDDFGELVLQRCRYSLGGSLATKEASERLESITVLLKCWYRKTCA